MVRTLASVAAQTIPPALWVVVDDGSTDETPAILQEHLARLPYLRVVSRPDRGRRRVGPGVIEAFYAGLETVDLAAFAYVCKLDLDLELPPRYFELLIARWRRIRAWERPPGSPTFPTPRPAPSCPRSAGTRCPSQDEVLPHGVLPRDRRFRPRGDVGRDRLPPLSHARLDGGQRRRRASPLPAPSGHGSSERACGRAGSARASASTSWEPRPSTWWRARSSGCRCIRSSTGAWGCSGATSRALCAGRPRYDDPAFRRFLRAYQRRCLLRGKRAATSQLNAARRPSGARPTHRPASRGRTCAALPAQSDDSQGTRGSGDARGGEAALPRGEDERGPAPPGAGRIRPLGIERPEVVFGHRRLAILDLSEAGAQPMIDARLRLCASPSTARSTTSGEIRRDLESLGEIFRSSCDTEVILKAYKRWGIDAVKRFRGIFALALWDPRARAVHLVRDPMGIKPLYWTIVRDADTGEEIVLFASEVRALLASGAVPRRLDPAAVASYLWHGFVVGPDTIVEGVHLLPAASILTIERRRQGAAQNRRSLRQYWRMPSSAGRRTSVAELRDELLADRQDAARRPTCRWASSSRAESTRARWRPWPARWSPDAVHTFTIGFDVAAYDETRYAQRWPTRSGATTPASCSRQQAFQEQLPDAFTAIDQPTFDGINTYFVSRAAREAGMTVALAGHRRRRALRRLPELRRHPEGPACAARWLPFGGAGLGGGLERRRRAGVGLVRRPVLGSPRGGAAADALGQAGRRRRAVRDPLGLYQVSYALFTRETQAVLAGERRPGAQRSADYGLPADGRRRLAPADRGQRAAARRSRCWSSPASSASGCCATPTPPAWRSPSRCACPSSTTSSSRRSPASTRTAASRPPGRSSSCATWRSPDSTPRSSTGPSPASCCPSTPGRASACSRRWRPSSPTPARSPRRACAATPCRRCGAPSWPGRPGLYWSRIWALYVLLSWCQTHDVALAG